MIPDFKTYIKESIWGDIRKRGNGTDVKKEDDVNHMNFDTFADYIKDNYSEKGDWFSIGESSDEKSRHIEIDIISGIDLSFNVVNGKIYNILIQNNANKYIDVPGLKKIFNVNILGSGTFGVVEKDWTRSNNTFVKLIEFFLEKKTNESIWNDIRRRGNGTDVKKEDDVDLLEPQAFVEYLRETYKNVNTDFHIFKDLNDKITVPIFETDLGTKVTWFLEYDCDKNEVFVWKQFLIKDDELFNKLKNNYKTEIIKKDFTEYVLIEPKIGKSSNKFFIEIIDYILENAYIFFKRILVKNNKLSESIWNDIRRRGNGTDVKEEDNINNLDCEGLTDYLKKHYKPLNAYAVITSVADIISVPIIRNHTNSSIMFACKTNKVKMTNDIVDRVHGLLRVMENNFSIETFEGEDGTGEYKVYTISPKDGSEVTNKFFIEVIDFLLYHIPGDLYNKSIVKIDDKS